MAVLVLRTNVGQATEVLIPDAGVEVPASGVPVTFESLDVLMELAQSVDLVALAQDDMFGVGSSTIIVNDGTSDIDQDLVDEFLDTVFLTRSGPYSVVLRDENGDGGGGFDEATHEVLDTLVHNLAEDLFSEVTYDSFFRITNITHWTDATKTLKVREQQATYVGLSRRIDVKTKIQYDELGVEVARTETTYTYSGLRIVSSTTVRS